MPLAVTSRPTLDHRTLLALGAATAACSLAGHAHSQPWTPLRVILPVSAGSGVDVIMRSAQIALSKALGGQPVVIDNMPGAGGITGTQAIVRAALEGNTIGAPHRSTHDCRRIAVNPNARHATCSIEPIQARLCTRTSPRG